MGSNDSNSRDCGTSFDFDKLFEDVKLDEKIKDDKSFNSSVFSYLKDALISFIEHNSKHHLIIGLTGKWGAGKTSFCRYLEYSLNKEFNSKERESCEEAYSKNKDNLSSSEESPQINSNPSNSMKSVDKREYVFFFYDLWTHQHETLRKSILSELSSYLLDKKVLNNKSSSHPNESLFEWMKVTNVGSIYNHVKSTIHPIFRFSIILTGGYSLFDCLYSYSSFFRTLCCNLVQFINNINFNCVEIYCTHTNQFFIPCGTFLLLLSVCIIVYALISRFNSSFKSFLSRLLAFLLGKLLLKEVYPQKIKIFHLQICVSG